MISAFINQISLTQEAKSKLAKVLPMILAVSLGSCDCSKIQEKSLSSQVALIGNVT